MPIYQYRCVACENEFESLEGMDTDLTFCDICSHINGDMPTAKRIMSAGSFRINGHSEANGYHYQGGERVYKS